MRKSIANTWGVQPPGSPVFFVTRFTMEWVKCESVEPSLGNVRGFLWEYGNAPFDETHATRIWQTHHGCEYYEQIPGACGTVEFSECFLSQDLTCSCWQKGGVGGDTRMKSGMAITVTPPTIISVFQARGFLESLPSIHSSSNYHIHVTEKELAQLDLKSFVPDSRSPAFFPYTIWPLGRSLSCPNLQLGILRPGIGAFDGV